MPKQLVDIDIEAVAGVDRAANKRQFLVIKRADEDVGKVAKDTNKVKGGDGVAEGPITRLLQAVGKRLGWTAEEMQQVAQDAEGAPNLKKNDDPKTLNEVLDHDRAMNEFWDLQWAFERSLRSILEHGEDGEKAMLLATSVAEFAAKMQPIIERLSTDTMRVAARDMLADLTKATDADKAREALAKAATRIANERGETVEGMRDMLAKMLGDTGGIKRPDHSPDPVKKGDHGDMSDNGQMEAVAKRLEESLEKAAGRLSALEKQFTESETQRVALEKRATDAETKLVKAEEALAVEREVRVTAEYLAKAKQYIHPGMTHDDAATLLRKADEAGIGDQIIKTWQAAEVALRDGGVFKSVGSAAQDPNAGDAYAVIEKRGAEIARERGISKEKGVAAYLATDEGKRAYAQYENGGVN